MLRIIKVLIYSMLQYMKTANEHQHFYRVNNCGILVDYICSIVQINPELWNDLIFLHLIQLI
ncbi:unnamed protein product [Acanthoscelides obtectus]|uniref:Uncharacterized protein n=1 Tax=Acanthoscelides obtectus TaxID=200917 RepID=A0A9P0KN90_ACAOB|nr:unnamed protein product [Acanthoscelides obtectus]CAK1620633.1 hypothetical protein AOBTE_LOCUS483 [Acanthoscelides obtectus]